MLSLTQLDEPRAIGLGERKRDSPRLHVFNSLDPEADHVHGELGVEAVLPLQLEPARMGPDPEHLFPLSTKVAEESLTRRARRGEFGHRPAHLSAPFVKLM